jgi:hypothetical protein
MLRMEHDLCKEQIQTTTPPASDEAVCYHLWVMILDPGKIAHLRCAGSVAGVRWFTMIPLHPERAQSLVFNLRG